MNCLSSLEMKLWELETNKNENKNIYTWYLNYIINPNTTGVCWSNQNNESKESK